MGHLDTQRSLPVPEPRSGGPSAQASVAGYKPVAFVAVDEAWTALRFKRM